MYTVTPTSRRKIARLAADSRQQAEPHSRAVVEPAKLPVAVAQRFHAEGLHVVEQRRAPWGMPEYPPGVLVFQAPEQVAGGQVGTPLGEAVAGQVQQPEATVAAAAGFAQGQVEGFAVARVEAIVVEAGAGVLAQLLGQRRFRRRAVRLRGAVHPLQLAHLRQRIADARQQPALDLATLAGGMPGSRARAVRALSSRVRDRRSLRRSSWAAARSCSKRSCWRRLWLICQSSRPSINRTSNSRPALAAGRSGTVSGSPAGGGDGVSEGRH